jgi:chitosanase
LATATAAAVVLVGAGALVYSAQAADEALLSQGRTATASSLEGTAFAAGNAVDGDTATRWASAEGVDPQWIQVDLGSVARVTRVQLSWEAAYATAFTLQISTDGTTWNVAQTVTGGDGGTDEITGLSASARFVRVHGTTRATPYGYSLWELKVFGGTGGTPPSPTPGATTSPRTRVDLTDPVKKDIAMQIVSSAENSSLDWRAQYGYIEDIEDGRGYTAGIIGFCSGTGDMLDVVTRYSRRKPGNILATYLPALRAVNGTDSHAGLDPGYPGDWRTAAQDPVFRATQDEVRDEVYFNPAVQQAKRDGLRALGQFVYYDAIVMHGPGNDAVSFGGIRAAALARATPPAQGGDETAFLHAFLDARVAAMKTEAAHSDTSRVDTAQRVWLRAGNLDLDTPLDWKVYGDPFHIS